MLTITNPNLQNEIETARHTFQERYGAEIPFDQFASIIFNLGFRTFRRDFGIWVKKPAKKTEYTTDQWNAVLRDLPTWDTEQMRVNIQSPDWIGWRINETLGLDGRTAKKDRDVLQLIIAHLKKEHLITKFRKHDKNHTLRHHWRPVQKKFVAME